MILLNHLKSPGGSDFYHETVVVSHMNYTLSKRK